MNGLSYKLIEARNISDECNDKYTSDGIKESYYELLRAEKCLEIAIDNRKLEIELLWKRTVIFWGFISILFVALYKISPQARFALSWIGLVFSFLWTWVNKGSKSWQQSWEIKTEYFIREIYKYDYLYKKAHEDKNSKHVKGLKKSEKIESFFKLIDAKTHFLTESDYSMSKLLISLSNFYIFIWIGAIIYYSDWPFILNFSNKSLVNIFMIFCIVYIIFSAFACKSNRKNNAKIEFNIIDS